MTDRLDRPDNQRSYSSRDYSAERSSYARGGTSTLERPLHSESRTPVLPRRQDVDSHGRKVRFQRSLGSQQRLSYRGRSLRANLKKVDPRTLRFVVLMTLTLVAGVFASMMLSGWTAQQTFEIRDLKNQQTTLSNQLETLNRDVQSASSSAEIARRASEMKLVVPEQPGILATNQSGDTVEQRPAGDVVRPIVDVNGQRVRASVASSDPNATDAVADELHAVPNTGGNNVQAPGYIGAPYAATATQGGNE